MSQFEPSSSSTDTQRKEVARTVGEAALRRIENFDRCTKLNPREVQQLDWCDIELGRLIGQGSFSSVYTASLKEGQHFHETIYALKSLKRRTTSKHESFTIGAVDLILEAKILSNLHHPNIIKLHAVRGGNICECYASGGGYFLVLDLLTCTLETCLDGLRDRRCRPFACAASSSGMIDRLETMALGVARGMAYLHAQNIIFRDLKPQNVGIDEHGVVRIFDFGLAREYHPTSCSQNSIIEGARLMTGNCGTPRYMAPEVAALQKYGFGCDVYSFSIMLWEICTLKKPFEKVKNVAAFQEEVFQGAMRPSLKMVSSSSLRELLKQGWTTNANDRQSFSNIVKSLENEISKNRKHRPTYKERRLSRSKSTTEVVSNSQAMRKLVHWIRRMGSTEANDEFVNSTCRTERGRDIFLDVTKRNQRYRLALEPIVPIEPLVA